MFQEKIDSICDRFFEQRLTVGEAENLFSSLVEAELEAKIRHHSVNANQKLRKKIFDECKPCIDLAKHLSIDFIEFIRQESQHHDAIFYFNSQAIEIECTSAINWREWSYKREHISLFKRAPVLMPIQKTFGSKHKRTIHETPLMSLSEDKIIKNTMEDLYARLPTILNKKITLQKEKGFYKNAILIIHFEDQHLVLPSSHLLPFLKELVNELKIINNEFKEIYLVGTSGLVIPFN